MDKIYFRIIRNFKDHSLISFWLAMLSGFLIYYLSSILQIKLISWIIFFAMLFILVGLPIVLMLKIITKRYAQLIDDQNNIFANYSLWQKCTIEGKIFLTILSLFSISASVFLGFSISYLVLFLFWRFK